MSSGGISAWAGSTIDWINSFGWAGWWAAGLLGALVAAVVLLCFAHMRRAWITTRAMREWKERVDTINPLAYEFNNTRIKLADVIHPIGNHIVGKKFIGCELIGPANLGLVANYEIQHVAFMNCDTVVVSGAAPTVNVVRIENVAIYGGAIWNCIIYIPPHMVPVFKQMNARFVTLTGDQEIDNPQPQGTEQKTQP